MWNVLAVDDSATSLALLERIIVRLGHRPMLADCGTRAMAMCATLRPDLILLDVMMPDIDGWELVARLRQMERLRAVPIVFQSSLERPEDIARCFACGAVDVIATPVRMARLAAIFEVLGAPAPALALPVRLPEPSRISGFQFRPIAV